MTSNILSATLYSDSAINTEGAAFVAYAHTGTSEVGIVPGEMGIYIVILAHIVRDEPSEVLREEHDNLDDALRAFCSLINTESFNDLEEEVA